MKKLIFCLFAILIGVAATQSTQAQPAYTTPLGIAMEEYTYPYPVKFFSLKNEDEPVRMAYMDVQFQFIQAPPRSGVIVLLHGKNFYGSYWGNTINALAAQGYRVIVPDQIGFGKSSKPDIAYSFDLLAANTAALLDELKIPKAAIIGHSMGGMLAVRFARNYPTRTSQLVLENPIGLEDYRFKIPPQSTEELFQAELKNTDADKYRAFLKRYFVKWDDSYESFVEVKARTALSGEYSRWAKASARTYQMIYQQPVRHEFGLIKVPTLLVIGQSDRTTLGRGVVAEEILKTMGQYPQLGKSAARDIPGSKLVELVNVGHIPHLESPQKFHQALLGFLKPKK